MMNCTVFLSAPICLKPASGTQPFLDRERTRTCARCLLLSTSLPLWHRSYTACRQLMTNNLALPRHSHDMSLD